jgi:DegV family protein with EDD domain
MASRSVALVTDSTAYLPAKLLEEYGIFVVPNVVNWGTQTYRDGVDIQSTEFFERLKKDPVLPTTAVASIGEFREIYGRAADAADAVLGVHLSAKLSGTYSTAVQAASMLPGKRIEVVDSNATAMAMGFVVLAAARAAQAGKSFDEVRQAARDTIPHVGVVFTVETLEFLRRGGRIGGATAFMGSLLDMKPILDLRDGRVEPIERVRTKKKAVERVLEIIVQRADSQRPVRLATLHAAAPQEAAALLEAASSRLSAEEALLCDVSPTVATHAGPGTVGLAYCAGI